MYSKILDMIPELTLCSQIDRIENQLVSTSGLCPELGSEAKEHQIALAMRQVQHGTSSL